MPLCLSLPLSLPLRISLAVAVSVNFPFADDDFESGKRTAGKMIGLIRRL